MKLKVLSLLLVLGLATALGACDQGTTDGTTSPSPAEESPASPATSP